MGAVALAFFNCYTALANATFLQGSYQEAIDYTPSSTDDNINDSQTLNPLKIGRGEWWWVGLLAGAGLAVGLLKVVWTKLLPNHEFKENIPGFLEELSNLTIEDRLLPLGMMIASAISIGMGASVGPEVALGAMGTALGCTMGCRWRRGGPSQSGPILADDDERNGETSDEREKHGFLSYLLPDFSRDKSMCVLDGIAAAFGAIFPNQLLSPLLLFELGGHWGHGGRFSLVETLARTGISATFSYALFTGFEDRTLLDIIVLPAAAYDVLPIIQTRLLVYATGMGCFCGLVGFVGFLFLAVSKVVGALVSTKLNDLGERMGLGPNVLGKLLTPMIGGVVHGLLVVAAPLNLSDGSEQMSLIITNGKELGKETIIVSGLLKLLSMSVCIGFGFIGGPFFPLIFSGACVGSAINLIIPEIPALVTVPCCLVAVATSILPGIFTFTILSSFIFVLGGPLTAPVFIACISSYTVVSGMGLVQVLLTKAIAKNGADV